MPIIQQMPIKENILLSYINDFKNQEKDEENYEKIIYINVMFIYFYFHG